MSNALTPSKRRFSKSYSQLDDESSNQRSKLAAAGEAMNHGVTALNALGQICLCLDEIFNSNDGTPRNKNRK